MAPLDRLIFWSFAILSIAGIVIAAVSFRKALRAASRNDEGLRMFMWSVGTLVGLILAAASLLYFLLPLIYHYSTE